MREQWCLFIAKPAEIPRWWLFEWVEGIIQCFWKAGRDRRTEAPGSISGKNYGWVNKARKKKLFSPFLLVREKKPNQIQINLYASLRALWKAGHGQSHGDRLVGVGLGRVLCRDHAHRLVCSKRAEPLNLQQWHLLQGFLNFPMKKL